METNPCSFEFTVISAENLTVGHRPIKSNAFVTINETQTSADRDGGSFPCWNEKLRLSLPSTSKSVAVAVHCKSGARVRTIGKAAVPVSDFWGGILPVDYLHFLSYRLREDSGERNGIVNISVTICLPDIQVPWPVPGATQMMWGGGSVDLPRPSHHHGWY